MDDVISEYHRFMLEPARYLHSSYGFPDYTVLSPTERVIFNHFLIDEYKLKCEFNENESRYIAWMMGNQTVLEESAFYLGCLHCYEILLLNNQYKDLCFGAQAFAKLKNVLLPVMPIQTGTVQLVEESQLISIGFSLLHRFLVSHAPSMTDHLCLLFEKGIILKQTDLIPYSILTMATDYVKAFR